MLTFDYRTRMPGKEWEPVQAPVPLARTPCRYGGSRPWFLSPGCGTRRAVLFCVDGRFRCRICHGLAYSCMRETPWQRSRRRAEGIRARLAGTRPFPEKPPRMRWATYERLRRELDAAEGQAFGGFLAQHEELIERLRRECRPS